MLVICNGAIKSGSTWLYNILTHIVKFNHPPNQYLTQGNKKHPCIQPQKLNDFLAQEDYKNINYISKNHLGKPEYKSLLLSHENVCVFDIERDSRDVVVSNYYHDCFRNGYKGTFDEYYWQTGRKVVAGLASYHNLWRDGGQNVYLSSYEKLHHDFHNEVRRIAAVLKVSLTPKEVENISQKTSIDNLRKQYRNDPHFQGSKFFRKGAIGDWKTHFSKALIKDIKHVEERGIGKIDIPKLKYKLRQFAKR